MELSELVGTNGFKISGEGAGDFSGQAVSGAGDVNGDGFDDLLIGASNVGGGAGASYVVFGQEGGFGANLDLSSLTGANGFQISGEVGGDYSGHRVSAAGDVNGDGYDDLLMNAVFADPNGSNSGASYVVFGQAGGFGANLDLSSLTGANGFQMSGEAADDSAGRSVSAAGDVNGDGYDDLLIGAVSAAPNGFGSGASYVVFGQAGGFGANLDLSSLSGANGFQMSGEAANDLSGWSVSGAGDVNGDGFADLIIGAVFADPSGSYSGASYVVFGQAGGFGANLDLSSLTGANGFRISGEAEGDLSGFSVSGAGDVNGDGFDDLLIGARSHDLNGSDSGASYVVFGQAGGFGASLDLFSLTGTNGFQISGEAAGDASGYSVSGAGDVNGDGLADLIIGAIFADPNGSNSGASYVVFSQAGGFGTNLDLTSLTGTNGFQISGGAADDFLGYSVSGAGDVNGDGFDDLIISAPQADPNGNRSGASYVVFGSDLSGVVDSEGTAEDDDLTGDGDANIYVAGLGDDTLDGAGGADVLRGGADDDLLIGGAGDDRLFGGLGFDVASYETESQAVIANLRTGRASGASAGADLLDGLEGVIGSDFGDTLIGDHEANLLTGGAGNDTLTGGASGDVFRIAAGSGADRITDFFGQDVIDVAGVTLVEPVTSGDGSTVLAGEVQVSSAGGVTTLHIGVDANAGADLTVLLSGTFTESDLLIVSGNIATSAATGNTAPIGGSIPDANASEGVAFDFTVPGGAFTDADPGDTLTYSATLADGSELPSWLDFDPETRTFSGMPEGATITIVVTATDEAGASASAFFDIIVASTADSVTGTFSADVLDPGVGADTMRGMQGDDTYIVDNIGDVVIENPLFGTDQVWSSVTYTLPANVEDMILTGGAAIDGTGNIRPNAMFGNSAANRLDGGQAIDQLTGGDGDDIYVVDNSNDIVEEAEDEGDDLVQSSVAYSLADKANVERLTLTGTGHTSATGNTMANTLTGNGGNNLLMGEDGDDTLEGGSGDDTLDGGEGSDSMTGGAGNDTYIVDDELDTVTENPSEGTADTVYSSVGFTLAANVENLFLTGEGEIDGEGNGLSNQLFGNTASNQLTGGAGDDLLKGADILTGNTGADTLIGGTGNDLYYVDSANDVVTELAGAGQGIDRIYTTVNLTLPDNVEHVTVVDTYALFIVGNGLNNSFQGEDGHDNLHGGGGNDTLDGGLGNDTLNGGTGNDSLKGAVGNDIYIIDAAGDIVVESGNQGTDTIQSTVTHTLEANVEYLLLLGAGDIDGNGNTSSNRIIGNAGSNDLAGGGGNDTLNGAAGIDRILGNEGNDSIVGGSGDDLLAGGTGADIMVGGGGSDVYEVDSAGDLVVETSNAVGGVVLPGAPAGIGGITDTVVAAINYSLANLAFVENVTLKGSGALSAIGNGLNNALTGNAGANTLAGGSGNDTLNGGGGVDTVKGDAGSDTLAWAANDALLDGGSGTDTLRLDGGKVTLDLTTLPNAKIKNVETINITGTGNNTLKLAASDLLDLSSTSNTLRVDGDAGDRVQAQGFTDAGSISGGLRRYTSGAAILLVESDVSVIL